MAWKKWGIKEAPIDHRVKQTYRGSAQEIVDQSDDKTLRKERFKGDIKKVGRGIANFAGRAADAIQKGEAHRKTGGALPDFNNPFGSKQATKGKKSKNNSRDEFNQLPRLF